MLDRTAHIGRDVDSERPALGTDTLGISRVRVERSNPQRNDGHEPDQRCAQ